jgi:hypothetical protein
MSVKITKLKELIRKSLSWWVILLALLPGYFLAYASIEEPWTLFRLARIISSHELNHISDYAASASSFRSEHLAGELLLSSILSLSHWPPDWLSLLPIGSLIIVIQYYALALKISGSNFLAAAIALYAGWYYPRLVSQYSIQTYVWTNLLFLGFLTIYFDWLGEKKPIRTILIIFVFITTFLFYQTTPIWIIATLFFTTFIDALKSYTRHSDYKRISWSLPIFSLVLYLSFDTVIYGNFLKRVTSEAVDDSLFQSITSKIVLPILGKSTSALSPFEIAPTNPRIATWTTLISLTIMVLPVLVWVLYKLLLAITENNFLEVVKTKEDQFSWSIIFIAIVHAVGYSAYGAISIRVIPLAFPLIFLVFFRDRKWKLAGILSLWLLALVSVLGFLSFSSGYSPDLKPSSFGFAAKILRNSSTIFSDTNIFGLLQVDSAKDGKVFDLSWVSSDGYAFLVNDNESVKPITDYFILDKSGKPVQSSNWVSYEPWKMNFYEIDNNPNLDKFYDSKYISIYQLTNNALPKGIEIPKEVPQNKNLLIVRAIKICLTIILLLLLPGGILLHLLKTLSIFSWNEEYSFIALCLIISISMITVISYIANFTILGLNLIVPIIILICSTMVFIIILRNRSKKPEEPFYLSSLKSTYIFYIGLVILWAIISTITIQKTINTNDYIELFATQSLNKGFVNIYVVNRTKTVEIFDMAIFVGENSLDRLKSIQIYPFSSYVSVQRLPKNKIGEKITILLLKGDRTYEEIHFKSVVSE